MLLKNKAKRLISINLSTKVGDVIELMPAGVAVDVPDEVCDTDYVKALIESGSVKVTGESPKVDDSLAEMSVDDLKAFADSLEIKYDSKIKKADLKQLIEENGV